MDRSEGDTTVALVDAGEGRRLERFGPLLVDRPAAVAAGRRVDPGAWRHADLRFEDGIGWLRADGRPAEVGPWVVDVAGLAMELRPTASGGVGLYPEHAANIPWLRGAILRRMAASEARPAPSVLNLFGHTGLLTLAAARAGAAVAHVDAARTSVAWARRNAVLNDLADRPIRWLVDDAGSFVDREARRGRRYDGVVLDPPSFGRSGRRSRRFEIDRDLDALLRACASVAAEDAFVLVTAHSANLDTDRLAAAVAASFGGSPDVRALDLVAAGGARLELGQAVRVDRLGGERDGAP